VGIPTLWLKVLHRVPVVYEIQDLWPETLAATGMVSSRAVLAAVGMMARSVYHAVDALVVQSPGMKQNLVAKGVSPETVAVIPNWADEDLYRPVEPDPRLAAAEGMAGRFNVVFAGNLGSAQGLGTLLDAAILLEDHPRIQFVFVGDGVDEPTLRAKTRARSLRNVLYLGRRPPQEMPGLFALASALIVHLKKDPLFAMTIPSKIPAYLASGRPIVAAVEGDAATVVRDTQAGIVCSPEDPAAIARALVTLDEMSAPARERLGQNGREAFLRSYARRQLIPLYESLFSRIARAAGHRVELR
jgi:glycosyltransferase involved in cell wall biosynthesis